MKRTVALWLATLLFPVLASAQKVSVSTNILDWLNLGTVNIEGGLSLSQHLSLSAGGRLNPWSFEQDDPFMVIRERQKTLYAGARWWPWYVFTGWWAGAKLQYSDYEETGIWRPARNTGKGVGAGLSAGYTRMLTERLNLEFGLGVWGGYLVDYTLFYSPATSDVRETGGKPFIAPDFLSVSVVYVF